MRRREVLRAAGWGLLSALPVAGCSAGGSGTAAVNRPRPDTSASHETAAATAGVPTTTRPLTTTRPAADGIGGRLLEADVRRQTPVAAAAAAKQLLPVSAALYRTALPGEGNAVLSPYSIVTALGMLALGARGSTAQQLATVLGGDAPTVARWLGGVDAALARAEVASTQNAYGSAPVPAVIEPANAVFVGSDTPVYPAYLHALATGYGAGVREVHFSAAAAARAAINQWVAQRTHGLIPDLIPPDFVNADTITVLVNALYLRAAWANPFDPGTAPMPFTTLSGTVSVPFMTRSDKMLYASGPKWQATSIPLSAMLAMTVIVPTAGSFRQVSAGLDAKLLAAATNGQERQVELAMPAFTTDVQTDLEKPLTAMGLGSLFNTPDLSGIAPNALRISGAVHQARIAVDDKGIEAAAATAVAIPMSGALPAPPLRLDRPFLYLVHDVDTRTPLFLGRVTDPTR
ncbi:serpin family protein [Nakamurella sp. PAMC28650]|uniref:serpin family protein n=1 Tax=Nakamurella sp. PAMC28650 TaxID=2762325 RepID=UPI00164ED84E|nr:serpin family protein [Nakamurella sp. PAMC28650]QNK79476.1 serpin family protein [Nakamurella sp. PAMC28650]